MTLRSTLLAAPALGLAGLLLTTGSGDAYALLGGSLDLGQRDFRVHDNFSDASANDNSVHDHNFPGTVGAALAIRKGVAEWGSGLRRDGNGDPHQPGDLGSGGANFDSSYQGLAPDPGGPNDNVFSEISGLSAGVLAFTELPISDGWRIRFYRSPWDWHDGPGPTPATDNDQKDIQGVAAHEYGHALGLDHPITSGATMDAGSSGTMDSRRSIEADDIAGIQAIYGVASPTKPKIEGLLLVGSQLTIHGANFDPLANDVWFTAGGGLGDGTPVTVAGLSASAGGTRIDLTVPAGADSGDLLVRVPGATGASLSNSWPIDLVLGECPLFESYGTPKINSLGNTVSLVPSGIPSVTYDSFRIDVPFGAPSNAPGILFYGSGQAALPFMGGTLYSSAPYVRDQTFLFGFFGDAQLPIATVPAMAGTKRYYQIWYQDAGDAFGVGLSDAVAVTFCP